MIEISNENDSEKFDEYVRRADDAHQKRKLRSLIRNSKKALAINPNYIKGWMDLGIAYRLMNKPYKALDCYDHVPTDDPNYSEVLFFRASANEEILGLLNKKKKKYHKNLIDISVFITPFYLAPIGLIILQVFYSNLITTIEFFIPYIRSLIFFGMISVIVFDLLASLLLYRSIKKFVSVKNDCSNLKNKLFQSNLSE